MKLSSILRLTIAGIIFVTVAVPLPANPAKHMTASPTATNIDSAEELFNLLVDPNAVSISAIETFEVVFAQGLISRPTFVRIEKEYPGFSSAVKEKLHTEVLKWSPNLVSTLRISTVENYRQRLNNAEILQLLSFYRTPLGTRLIAAARVGAQKALGRGSGDESSSSSPSLSARKIEKYNQIVIPSVIDSVEPSDEAELKAFSESIAAKKMLGIQQELFEVTTNVLEAELEKFSSILGQRMIAFAIEYLARHERNR